jgi:hypothetical protein
LLGTSFSFVHWLDRLDQHGERYDLPKGSRLMDTGGYKGRTREIPAPTMRARYARRLGLDPAYCVNEYGMTELCSQYYDASLSERVARAGDERGTARQAAAGDGAPRRKVAPPWMRTRVVDPETLAPVVPGARGLLQHFDLANLGSVVAVQTEDVGCAVDDGIVVEGRAPAAPPRGCSIALDMLLDATRAHQAGLAAHQTAHPLTPPGAEVDP